MIKHSNQYYDKLHLGSKTNQLQRQSFSLQIQRTRQEKWESR